ncbi:sugar ABC transporter permease [Parablautia intestinalis]|jgi:raffinose/stachyose/melibiose transport system permease protein|uniref:Sugar ABC transporter permease n=1 Tax=Parablautia intestinalis TaxID=2320100 RepID=A0A3A9B2Q3_9FIRM|nr:sugar ABC transporter permease [Parablautia intestinalis]MCI8615533.1 sugar ABC transporter permease [Lachnospiraceae bacterium]RKI94033.1 sugar ABC transporter permease [Parablautia intestinalis]
MRKRNMQMNMLYLPALFVVLLFVLYPLIRSFRMSFYNWNGYSPVKMFIGFDNYKNLLSDKNFAVSFKNTLLYGFGSTILQNILGLSFALFLNTKFKGHKVVRTIVYLPVMISGLIMGYIMYFMVRNQGAVNEILGWFSITGLDWMGDGNVGRWIITFVNSWQYCGYCMVIYMAGLQGISRQYYEAAAIDGATSWKSFRYITLPLLIPAMSSAIVINLIGGLKLYDVVVSLSNGGPNYMTSSLSFYINNRYLSAEQAGYASAVGVVMFLFIMLCSQILNGYFRKKEVEM